MNYLRSKRCYTYHTEFTPTVGETTFFDEFIDFLLQLLDLLLGPKELINISGSEKYTKKFAKSYSGSSQTMHFSHNSSMTVFFILHNRLSPQI